MILYIANPTQESMHGCGQPCKIRVGHLIDSCLDSSPMLPPLCCQMALASQKSRSTRSSGTVRYFQWFATSILIRFRSTQTYAHPRIPILRASVDDGGQASPLNFNCFFLFPHIPGFFMRLLPIFRVKFKRTRWCLIYAPSKQYNRCHTSCISCCFQR